MGHFFCTYFFEGIDERRKGPNSDLISQMIRLCVASKIADFVIFLLYGRIKEQSDDFQISI